MDATTGRLLDAALATDPLEVREAAADARALRVATLAAAVTSSEAARLMLVTDNVVTKANNRARDVRADPDRLARAGRLATAWLGHTGETGGNRACQP